MLQLQKGLAKLFNLGDDQKEDLSQVNDDSVLQVIKAVNTEERKCVEIVYKPDAKDAHDQFMNAEEIIKAEQSFQRNEVVSNLFHLVETDKFTIEKSWVTESDTTFEGREEVVQKGTWLVETHYGDEALWELKKSGEMGGLSLGGYGHVNKATGEITKVRFNKDEYLEAMKEDEE